MPRGKTHDAINLASALPIFILSLMISGYSVGSAAIVTLAALFAGYMFGPDLDIKSNHYYRWGLLRFLWVPYRQFFQHRSKYTHTPIVSTVVQILYLFVFFSICIVLYIYVCHIDVRQYSYIIWQEMCQIIISYKKELYACIVGLIVGSSLHIAADVMVSSYKKLFKSL